MKKLKEYFEKKKISYQCLGRTEHSALYAAVLQETNSVSFEVFKIKVSKPWQYCDDFSENYPADEAFGSTAWSCTTKNSLFKIMNDHFQDDKEFYDLVIGSIDSIFDVWYSSGSSYLPSDE